ncbi:MAG TPA: sigma 54-interacting transcriptional regulator [Polyangiaceae bacterium]|jgi:transcriptional regulator with GAF, ATPase, and Fis domain|nr:sigma 54-interacting transcriptional regulator [Polyangiaceae bacterium]
MSSLRLEVVSGAQAGRVFDAELDVIRIGRSADNDLVLPDAHVSGEHARIVSSIDGFVLEDLDSTNGTWLTRGGERQALGEGQRTIALSSGDRIELGGQGNEGTELRLSFELDTDTIEVALLRPLSELGNAAAGFGDAPDRLKLLVQALREIVSREGQSDVASGIADAALLLVPRATHATVVLHQDVEGGRDAKAVGFVPVITRVRGPAGPRAPDAAVRLTRSVVRKVISERAAVLAADAPSETFSSESLLGASIRSTIGVPLWKDDTILGVLQLDNRDAPAMFEARDVDALGALAVSASLAIANAELIQRLSLARAELKKENQYLRGKERARSGEVQIIGDSKAMSALLRMLDKVVDTKVSVLIEGETGTGKELVASAVHYRSRRKDKLFVAQNCAAFLENLLESELFGHKRGAFTGATDEKKGLFEIADGGTLFLDEVGEMPLSLQAKLLRALQEGEIRPVGGTQPKQVNVRIVAATNRNLENEVRAGRFREDLYYRLKVFPLRVPPLRERRDDIAPLAIYFLARYTREMAKAVRGFAQETLEILSSYDFPGNVRELENEVQRLVIQAEDDGFITPELLSPRVRQIESVLVNAGAAKGSLKEMVDQVERHILIEALREHGNNKTAAAKTLGITREGLHKKLKQLGVS